MGKIPVSIVRYREPYTSVKEAVLSCGGLDRMPPKARVFIKPNIVFWTKACAFPKWGVITTSRVIEDAVVLLKEHGIEEITIGEGIMTDPKDTETPAHAFKTLGYDNLRRRYGVKYINIMERPFEKVDLGDGVILRMNKDILDSDFVVNIPVMKTHNQTVVSLGIKNLKGTIDVASRKKCHGPDPEKNLHFHVSKLADPMPPMLTIIDGIYSLGARPQLRRQDEAEQPAGGLPRFPGRRHGGGPGSGGTNRKGCPTWPWRPAGAAVPWIFPTWRSGEKSWKM